MIDMFEKDYETELIELNLDEYDSKESSFIDNWEFEMENSEKCIVKVDYSNPLCKTNKGDKYILASHGCNTRPFPSFNGNLDFRMMMTVLEREFEHYQKELEVDKSELYDKNILRGCNFSCKLIDNRYCELSFNPNTLLRESQSRKSFLVSSYTGYLPFNYFIHANFQVFLQKRFM